ncbi:MAG: hypothetical protein K6E85_16500 [Lachnospiraceae bacterium]|nr:hypothetical protein [Lachnospiraceae bacterium]
MMGVYINDKVFKFAFDMAFRDATLRMAFPRKSGEQNSDFQKRKEVVRDKDKPIVKNYIDSIFDNGNNEPPDPTEYIINSCDKENDFTFGNAQKLVNMTAKYMFIASYANEEMRERFRNCHCPMDSVMLKKIRRKSLKDAGWNSELSWSRLKCDDIKVPAEYESFQKNVRNIAIEEGILPLEVDFLYWDEGYELIK